MHSFNFFLKETQFKNISFCSYNRSSIFISNENHLKRLIQIQNFAQFIYAIII